MSSSLNLPTLLQSINSIYNKNNEEEQRDTQYITERLLSKRLAKEMDLGPMADSELFDDLARALVRCRLRYDCAASKYPNISHISATTTTGSTTTASTTTTTATCTTSTSTTPSATAPRSSNGYHSKQSRFNIHDLDDDSDISIDGTITSKDTTTNEDIELNPDDSQNPATNDNKPADNMMNGDTDSHSYRVKVDNNGADMDSDEEDEKEIQEEIKEKMQEMNIDPFQNCFEDDNVDTTNTTTTTTAGKSTNENDTKEDIAQNLCDEFDLMKTHGGTISQESDRTSEIGDENSQSTGNINHDDVIVVDREEEEKEYTKSPIVTSKSPLSPKPKPTHVSHTQKDDVPIDDETTVNSNGQTSTASTQNTAENMDEALDNNDDRQPDVDNPVHSTETMNSRCATPERHNLSAAASGMYRQTSSSSNKRVLHLSPEMSGRRPIPTSTTIPMNIPTSTPTATIPPQPCEETLESSSPKSPVFYPPPDDEDTDDDDLFFSPEPITSNETSSPVRIQKNDASDDHYNVHHHTHSTQNKTPLPDEGVEVVHNINATAGQIPFSKFDVPHFNIGTSTTSAASAKKQKRKKSTVAKASTSRANEPQGSENAERQWNSFVPDVEFLSPDTFTSQQKGDRYSAKLPATPYPKQIYTPDSVSEMDIDDSMENNKHPSPPSSMTDEQTKIFRETAAKAAAKAGVDLNTTMGFSTGGGPPRSSPLSRKNSNRGKHSAKKISKSSIDHKTEPKPALSFTLSSGSKSTKDSMLYSFSSSFDFQNLAQPSMQQIKTEKDREDELRSGRVEVQRETARSLYSCKKYVESVLEYSKAIVEHTNRFADFPDPMKDSRKSEILAALYGNRAAGLMMIGAFNAAASDCQKALGYLRDYNPLNLKSSSHEDLLAILKADGGLTLMTKLLARQGRAYIKMGDAIQAAKTFDYTIRVANSALACHKNAEERGIEIPIESQEQSKKVLNQCIIDATLNKSDLKKLKDMSDILNARGRLDDNIDDPVVRQRNQELLPTVDMMLNLCPSDTNIQVAKVIFLASMHKWRDVASFCEMQACKNADFDGIFVEDLKELNPFPVVPPATLLKTEVLKNEGTTMLSEEQVGEAVVRMPYGVLRLYLRSLRLEERYIEARKAQNSLNGYVDIDGSLYKQGDFSWFSIEREKVKRTMSGKDKGDAFYRNGEYLLAAEKYASVLRIDSEESLRANLHEDPWEFKTVGGRLHAILHCNRAACFMAMKHFKEAAKECTAALRIETKYMKAMLRRARCNARLEHYEESIAEYKRWSNLVEEARMNPDSVGDDVCTFDLAADISNEDYNKAQGEMKDVKKMKDAVEQQARVKANEREKFRQSFYQSSRSNFSRSKSAYSRRQEWYNQEGDASSRRWDTFEGTSPKKTSPKKHSPKRNTSKQSRRSQSSRQERKQNADAQPSPSSNAVTCHYEVLQIGKTATEGEIKRAYRKKALQYHPDKNQNSSAAETFRKVKLAYEVLSDDKTRRLYDAERLRSHYQF